MAFSINNPLMQKTKGGGTKKVCLPKAKIASMSANEKQKVVDTFTVKSRKVEGSKGK